MENDVDYKTKQQVVGVTSGAAPNSFLGGGIGAGLGFLVGGPLGAAFGAFVGGLIGGNADLAQGKPTLARPQQAKVTARVRNRREHNSTNNARAYRR